MAINYTLNWSNNTLKPPFTLNGGVIDTTTTSLALPGKSTNWGERVQENMLHLLEHFSSPTPPDNATIGQFWYDSNNNQFRFLTIDNIWAVVWPHPISSSPTPVPTAPVPTAPVPTAPVPTAPVPTSPTAPIPTSPVPTAPIPTSPTPIFGPPVPPTAPTPIFGPPVPPTAPTPTTPTPTPAISTIVPLVDRTWFEGYGWAGSTTSALCWVSVTPMGWVYCYAGDSPGGIPNQIRYLDPYSSDHSTIGSSYWVRATLLSGSNPNGTVDQALNIWYNLGVTRGWTCIATTTGPAMLQYDNERLMTIRVDIATDAAGSNIVNTATYTMDSYAYGNA